MKSKTEQTYEIGDMFLVDGDVYMLSQINHNELALIGLISGNRYEESVKYNGKWDLVPFSFIKNELATGSNIEPVKVKISYTMKRDLV